MGPHSLGRAINSNILNLLLFCQLRIVIGFDCFPPHVIHGIWLGDMVVGYGALRLLSRSVTSKKVGQYRYRVITFLFMLGIFTFPMLTPLLVLCVPGAG